ncbi:MAG TPA: excinuclease ABC subunit UvrC [Gammaproteobacteria bacterium]|nr:excinuclease ABC subunit UvrC [Xanthomonadales bacterium]MCB1595339.1 excinuclease ABC subunit UvrC [Xanthomonadales bacterium]HOP23031.1 excinuclease ABC subunit UvrC [Gammaproteobacteria bacterium]HPI96717.1 excinuclease ABC subunit UvrC [Gammaproteobacteria bacterium]HPQ88139.1 excinuclease ABC subunit UvrC [Gammaproteobacteria bacterium]
MPLDGKEFSKQLPQKPGIYQMFNELGKVIYVGKALNLKNRVSSYFTGIARDSKTMALVESIADIRFSITRTEGEALILENQLIKQHKPKYNILLKDGKSYPYIYCSENEDNFPRLEFRRGTKQGKGRYYGPFPSAQAVRHTLNHLQKLFKVRQCNNATYSNRSRPCLQYQINRCSAPCVGYVSDKDYEHQLHFTKEFLLGNSLNVINELVEEMQVKSNQMEFEKAAEIRDQIKELKIIQSQQVVESSNSMNLDIFSITSELGIFIVTMSAVRGGLLLGHKNFFPKTPKQESTDEVLQAFISQYYQDKPIPACIVVNIKMSEKKWLETALSQVSQSSVQIISTPRGDKKKMLELNITNMNNALELHISKKANWQHKWQMWVKQLQLKNPPNRVECFDISHVFGEQTRASCVVFDMNGAKKNMYRNYKISDITKGDDYAAMAQVIEKRLQSLNKHKYDYPDVFLIDGGKGQANQALKILKQNNINNIEIIGIAKDENRKAGEERLFVLSQNIVVKPESNSLLSHMVQHIRDEAHRFAITGHRKALAKSRKKSLLEGIDGIGEKRRNMLLQHFGGLQGLKKAGVDEMTQLNGISREIAQRLYEHLH